MENSPSRSKSIGTMIGLGCGIPLATIVIILTGVILYTSTQPEGGVQLANNIEDYALTYIDKNQLLEPDENLVAYYDVTLQLDSSEAAILTDSRILYHNKGKTMAIPLAEVERVEHEGDGMGGDRILVHSKTGESMLIEIAVWNGGDLFFSTLEKQVQQAQQANP